MKHWTMKDWDNAELFPLSEPLNNTSCSGKSGKSINVYKKTPKKQTNKKHTHIV